MLVLGLKGLGAEPLSITGFKTDKVLYDFDETVRFEALAKNPGPAREVVCKLTVRHGMDEMIALPEQKVKLPANGSVPLSFTWSGGKREYGFAATLEVDGIRTEPQIFEICHDWRKIERAAGKPSYHGIFDPEMSEQSMEDLVKFCRDWGYNRFHVFGSWQPEINRLNPTEKVWRFWTYREPNPGKSPAVARISADRIKAFIRKFHENGIKVTMYIHTPTYALPDESWIVYDPLSPGQRKHYAGDKAERRAYLEKNGLGVPDARKFAGDFGKKLAGAVSEFGWDGIFLDDFRRLIDYTAEGTDKEGKRLTDLSHNELHREVLGILVGEVKPVKDNFVFFLNGLHHAMYGIQNFPSRDMFGVNGEKFDEIKSAELGNFAYAGEWRDIARQANSPWQLGRSLRAVKEATRTPLDIVWTIAVPASHAKSDASFHGENADYTAREETVLPFTALILSNGFGYSDYYSSSPQGEFTDLKKSELARKRAAYLKFAARYGQYLYDLDSKWIPRGEVEVKAPDHVYWKGESFEKPLPGGREVYVNLINFDKSYLYARLWDRTRKVPEPVDGIEAAVKLRPGEKVTGVYMASPDRGGEPERLAFKMEGDRVSAVSPRLQYWNLLVFRIAGKSL